MITISIYRGTDLILSTKPNEQSNVKQELMGEHSLTLQFTLDILADLRIGDYCNVFGNTYYIHSQKLPVITKNSRFGFDYDVQLMAPQYLLQNVQFLDDLSQSNFSLFGTADTFIDLLISNARRNGINWKKGGVIASEYKNLTFSGVDCLSALGTLAQDFDTEWFVDGTTINLAKKLTATPYIFQYGKGKGMYDIKRQPADSSSVVTRLYVYGGTNNIPLNYRNGSTRLLLPAISDPQIPSNITYTVVNNNNGTETITFNWAAPTDANVLAVTIRRRLTTGSVTTFTDITGSKSGPLRMTIPIGTYEVIFRSELTGGGSVSSPSIIVTTFSSPYALLPGTNVSYIENNVYVNNDPAKGTKYGVIEDSQTFDDIYPHRTGKVTAVDATNQFKFIDTTLDFDINAQLLPGTPARVQFNTGQLAGYSFKIAKYDAVSKEVTILKNDDEKTLDIPSLLLRPAIGDEYVLIDMVMPQSYISAAETLLLQKAQDYLNTYSAPVYSYTIDLDPKWARLNKIQLKYGNVVRVIDTDLGIDQMKRVISIVKQLKDEYIYQITLGETAAPGLIQQINSSLSSNSNSINNINDSLQGSKVLNGTFIGDLTIEQGTIIGKDIPSASSTAGMLKLYIDANGKVWKGA